MSIVRDAMVVNLAIGSWVGQRLDKTASRKLTDDAGADADAARVNKHLVSKDALAPIQQAATAVRNHYYTMTLPWRDNGDRLLTRRMFTNFMDAHGPLKQKWQDEVETFLVATYPSSVARAEFRMGELFNPDDYPTVDQLRTKFYVLLDLDAVTDAKDFRVKLEDDQLVEVRLQMEDVMRGRLQKAVGDIWVRLSGTLQHYANTMGDPSKVFRDSTVDNLREIVELLPNLNVLDDPHLTQIANQITQDVLGWEAKELRKQPEARAAVAKKASSILDSLGEFAEAFAGLSSA